MVKEIPWERTANGYKAFLKENGKPSQFPLGLLITTAELKMTDLNVISADFKEDTLVFEPFLAAYIEEDDRAEFLAVYQLGFPPDEEDFEEWERRRSLGLPERCLRRVYWSKSQDIKHFRAARNKRAYVEEGDQMESVILFLTEQMYPEIINLAEMAQQMVQHGLLVHPIERSQPLWKRISLTFTGYPVFSLSYSPYSMECKELETWISQWRESFHQVDYTGGVMPNNRCFVSYSLSVSERIARFPE